jgi:hypothetical protein
MKKPISLFALASLSALVLLSSLILPACKVTKEKVEKWKKNGDTARLKKCLADGDQDTKVRVAAGMALFELGRYYGAEVQLGKVKKRSEAEAAKIADAMAAKLLPRLEGTSDQAVRAKDGLFSLTPFVSKKKRRKLESEIVRWLLEHYTSVASSGEHSAKKIFERLGPKAGALIAEVLEPTHGQIYEVARLVRKIASAEDRQTLAKRFIKAIEKNPRLQTNAQLIYAIGEICAKASLRFLQQKVESGYNYTIRRNGLIALRQCPHASSLEPTFGLLTELSKKAIAGQHVELPKFKDNKPGVIHQAFEVIDAVGKWEKAKPGLVKVLTLDGNKELDKKNQHRKLLIRMKAAQYMIYLGRTEGLEEVLKRIPRDEYPKGYIGLVVFAIKRQFSKKDTEKALKILRSSLKSPNWVARIVSIEAVRRLGTKEKDLALVKKLTTDKTVLEGWGEEGVTVGERAELAAKALTSR